MAQSTFEQLQGFLKTHPGARPVSHSERGRRPAADAPGSATPPSPERHGRKCTICHHPQREEIEFDFLRWKSSKDIAAAYGLPHHAAVCRHAHALGLFDRRHQTIRFALEPILEQADEAFMKVTPASVISAVTAYAKINHEGKHRRLPRINNIYFTTSEKAAGTADEVTPEDIIPNREIQKLITRITR